LHDAWREEHEEFWKQYLKGTPPLRLPFNTGPVAETDKGDISRFPFGEVLSAKLRDVALNARASLSLVVCTVYMAVMMRWCRQEDAILTFVASSRARPGSRLWPR